MALPAALSGLRLTHPADPMRPRTAASGQQEPPTGRHIPRRPNQYSGLLKSYTLPNRVSAGVFSFRNAKTPVMRFDGTNRGFRYSSEGAWVAAHLPERDLGGLPHTCSSQIHGGAIFVIELYEFAGDRP
ncbi:MAG: hypothetical protein PVI79_09335 [Gammaproteobacteria bacterium]